ncbi:MAG: DNA polymerase III subunit epsilon [Gammaproteobacteria bacterium]|nr:DNA polymerase III subunit epsilon [Gammaproteobacteria bacterium]
MRQIVLDTETTGLEVEEGHRVLEIGCVELIDRKLTHRHFHHYLNPQRDIDEGALEVHGITREFLQDKPVFADVAQPFLDFVKDAELIIHNAAFDVAFLNQELSNWDKKAGKITDYCAIIDSLEIARNRHPGQKNNLDALCKRYGVDNSQRDLHGALLDAEILADVYLLLTGGQTSLGLGQSSNQAGGTAAPQEARFERNGRSFRIIKASEEESGAHRDKLQRIQSISEVGCVWSKELPEGAG